MVVKLWNNTKHAENIIFLTLSDIGNPEPEEGQRKGWVSKMLYYIALDIEKRIFWNKNV